MFSSSVSVFNNQICMVVKCVRILFCKLMYHVIDFPDITGITITKIFISHTFNENP